MYVYISYTKGSILYTLYCTLFFHVMTYLEDYSTVIYKDPSHLFYGCILFKLSPIVEYLGCLQSYVITKYCN